MRILIAPNAFKGSVSAHEAAQAIARGVMDVAPHADVDICPISDGGDGLVEVLRTALGGTLHTATVAGPRGAPVAARFLLLENETAFVEMAEASGIALLAPEERDPMKTSSRGTGELVARALDLGATHVIVGLGGSATNDGGAGMAAALGVQFLGDGGTPIDPTGGSLESIRRIDDAGRDERVRAGTVDAAFDVHNPLLGANGASAVYGPQKGASPTDVTALDRGLANLAALIERDLGRDVRELEGAGAAGGLGAGIAGLLGGNLRHGSGLVLDLLAVDERIGQADIVVTGEGRLDDSSMHGKGPIALAERARAAGVPCIAVVGSATGTDARSAFDAVVELSRPGETADEAMHHATARLEEAARHAMSLRP